MENAEYKNMTEEQRTEITVLMYRHCKSVTFWTEIHTESTLKKLWSRVISLLYMYIY